jgi:MFS family permease
MERSIVEKDIDAARPSIVYVLIAAGVLILSYCVNAMDRTLFPLLLTDVRREYGLGLPEAGLLSTIFTLGMALAGIPTGYLLSRYSRKTVILVGMFIYSAGTVITVAAFGFSDMLIYRAATGIGEAMQLTALLAVFSGYFSRHRAVAVGALNYAYALGAIVAPILGTKLLLAHGTWRAPMIAFGALGFVLMLLVAAVVRPWLSEVSGGTLGCDIAKPKHLCAYGTQCPPWPRPLWLSRDVSNVPA